MPVQHFGAETNKPLVLGSFLPNYSNATMFLLLDIVVIVKRQQPCFGFTCVFVCTVSHNMTFHRKTESGLLLIILIISRYSMTHNQVQIVIKPSLSRYSFCLCSS